MFAHEKVMFEIYRESAYDRRYRVVFFTELDEHNKDEEIARAIAGEHLYDGFIREKALGEAKHAINELLEKLNRGEAMSQQALEEALAVYQA